MLRLCAFPASLALEGGREARALLVRPVEPSRGARGPGGQEGLASSRASCSTETLEEQWPPCSVLGEMLPASRSQGRKPQCLGPLRGGGIISVDLFLSELQTCCSRPSRDFGSRPSNF